MKKQYELPSDVIELDEEDMEQLAGAFRGWGCHHCGDYYGYDRRFRQGHEYNPYDYYGLDGQYGHYGHFGGHSY
ncbi:MAG TPA: hypothetical protein VHZ51_30475 [Ktedonobacteraceae bacterium]|nr:hypothetical protein [Ktedonobacteraceae bacterium]